MQQAERIPAIDLNETLTGNTVQILWDTNIDELEKSIDQASDDYTLQRGWYGFKIWYRTSPSFDVSGVTAKITFTSGTWHFNGGEIEGDVISEIDGNRMEERDVTYTINKSTELKMITGSSESNGTYTLVKNGVVKVELSTPVGYTAATQSGKTESTPYVITTYTNGNGERNDIMKPYYGVDDGGSIGVEGTQGDTGTKANAGAQAAKGTQGFRGGYEDFHLTSAQVEHIKRNNAIKAISKYIKENGVAPSSTEEYFTVTDEELEQYRRIFYSIYLGRGYVPSQSDDSVGNKTYTVSYNLTGCTKATYSETYDAGSRVPSVTFYPQPNYEFYKVTCAEGSGTPKWLLLDTVDSYSTPSIAEITSNWTYNIMCKSKTLKRVPEQELECSIE